MGKGIVLNSLEDGMVEVRMANGQKEKFYPEELETDEEVKVREERQMRKINEANKNRFNDDPYY